MLVPVRASPDNIGIAKNLSLPVPCPVWSVLPKFFSAVAWQTVNELACGESGIVHGAECIAVLNGVA